MATWYDFLPWDSDFFGCQIAQSFMKKELLREGLTYPDALALLQQKNIDLA